ncbi:MAG TPA: PqqD family protein [Actinomycetota bacterium]
MTEKLQPKDVEPEAAPRPRATVAHVEIDGEGVLYDEVSNQIHLLNPIATLIWSGLDGRTTLEELSAELSDAFGADLARVRFDVLEAVRGFAEQDLLEDEGAPPIEEPEAAQEASDEPRYLKDPPSP